MSEGEQAPPPAQLSPEDNAKKETLKGLLNQANALRNSLKGRLAPIEESQKLQNLANQCLEISTTLNMEHGKGLSLDMLLFALVAELDTNKASPPEYLALIPRVQEAEKIALSFNDVQLESRILETLANLMMRAGHYEQESKVIEKALIFSRTIPKVMALCNCYQRIINKIYEEAPSNADAMVKFHTEYWSQYLWLREQPGFDRAAWIQANRGQLYKIAVYIASIAGNPLNVGEDDPENFKIAKEAYDEAIHIAEKMNNTEFLCAAHAQKAFMLNTRITPAQRANLLKDMQQLEQTYKPTNIELAEVIKVLSENKPPPPKQEDVNR